MKLFSLYPEQFYSCDLTDLLTSSCIKVMLLEEEEEPLLIYTAQGSPFRRKKLSVINGSPEQRMIRTLKRAVVNNILKKLGHMCVVASLSYPAAVNFKFKDINGILFTVGNVDRDIGRHSGRYSGRQSVDSRSTVGR